MSDVLPANLLGFLALLCYVFTLLPTTLKIVFPSIKKIGVLQLLVRHRRSVGVLAFYLALCHGILLITKRNFDFFDVRTYWIYIQGIATFLIFSVLTITSNDWCIKKMKKRWKKLHELTYICMFLLTWHIWDKMSGHWSLLTPLGFTIMSMITSLFLRRKWIEYHNRKSQKSRIKSKKVVSSYDH